MSDLMTDERLDYLRNKGFLVDSTDRTHELIDALTAAHDRIEKLERELARLHSIIDDAHHLSTLSLTAENRRLFALLEAAERVCEAVQATRLPWGATPIVSVREALAEWEAVKEDTHE